MYEVSGELTLILVTIWWLQKLGKDWQLSKQVAKKFERERFNLWKLNELQVRKYYKIEITNRFAALENWDINRAWENIKETIKTSAKESIVLLN
jgi:hypothetical protein